MSLENQVTFDLGFNWEANEEAQEEESMGRFGNSTKATRKKIMSDRHWESTQRATKSALKILMDYLHQKKSKRSLRNHR